MDCNIFPTVLNKDGQTVDSKLFVDLFDSLKDRQLCKEIYLATKTKSFKDWFGTKNLDENGEPLLKTLSNGEKVFVNDQGEAKSISTSVKPGVSELFEFNPELANAVYEVAGFKTKADVILPIGTSGSGKSTFIKSLPQENLVVIEPDAMRVEFTGDMNDKSKDKEIYEEAAKRAIAAIRGTETPNQIYFKLGSKTKNNNIVINSVYQQKGVQYAKSIGGIFSLRVNNTNNHFGNPFSSVESEIQKGLIRTKSTKESVEKYIEWVLSPNTTIKPEQHKFIREWLQSGKLKGKPIVYYKELGEPSHATALDYLINKYDWENHGKSKQVVFDTTNLTKDKRLPFIEAIKKAIPNANIQYKLMELNPELAKQRIKAQLARGENRAAVSDETIDRHAASYKQMLEDIKSEPISNFEITPQQKQQAQQLYSQYLESLNNPNTNPILQGNQQEQVKKFAELQERLNNKEFLEGAKNLDENGEPLLKTLSNGEKVFVNDQGEAKSISTSVKPGVAELFESNPELANTVYEAVGFKNELKYIISKHDTNDDVFFKDKIVVTKELQNIKGNNYDGSINMDYEIIRERANEVNIGDTIDISDLIKPRSVTIDDVVKRFTISEENKYLLEKLKPIIKDIKIEYISKNIFGNSVGMYSDKYKTIRLLDISYLPRYERPNISEQEVFFHELLHAATFRKIVYFEENKSGLTKNESDALNELENIRKVLKELGKESSISTKNRGIVRNPLYGYTTDSIHEIISYAFTNKEFRNSISEIPYKANKSILDKLVELIANIFGVKQDTILSALLANTEVLLENNQITPQQKQQAQQLYSQYQQTGREDIEGFKEFVGNKTQEEDSLSMMPILNTTAAPKFENLEQHKFNLKVQYQDRIASVRLMKKKPAASASDIVALNKLERTLKDRLEEIEQEIKEISTASVIQDVDQIVQNDLDRMISLQGSDDFKDLLEAKEISDFYINAGPDVKNNSMFEEEDLFDNNGNSILTSDEWNTMYSWQRRAKDSGNIIQAKLQKKVMDSFNQNLSFQRMMGTKDFGDIFETTLKDASTFDLWLMDSTNGVFSNNGVVPQMLRIVLDSSMNDALSITTNYEERITLAAEKAENILKTLDGGKYKLRGVPGVKGVSWDIFFQKDLDGSRTGNLTSRYSKAWQEAEANIIKEIEKRMYSILTNPAKTASEKGKARIQSRREKIAWYRENTVIIDIQSYHEITNFILDPNNGFDFLIPHMNSTASPRLNLSENQEKEVISQQIELLKQFKYQYEGMIEYYLQKENVLTESALSPDAKENLKIWIHTHNPVSSYNATRDVPKYNSYISGGTPTNIIPELDFIVKIPRETKRVFNSSTKGYMKGDTTHYYDQQFLTIDDHKELYEFHQIGGEVLKFLKDVLPARDQNRMTDNQMGLITKSFTEIFSDPELTKFQKFTQAGRLLIEKITKIGAVITESTQEGSLPDLVTREKRKEVNKSQLIQNTKDIEKYFLLEKSRFLADATFQMPKIKPRTTIKETRLSSDNISHLAELLKAPSNLISDADKLDYIKATLKIKNPVSGNKVYAADIPVGRILYNKATDTVVRNHSYNLPKALIYYSQLAANYKARTEVKPYYETAMRFYKEIKNVETQNTSQPLISRRGTPVVKGLRNNAIKQIDSTHERALLGDYEGKHFWRLGNKKYYTRDQKKLIEKLRNEQLSVMGNPHLTTLQKTEISQEIDNQISELGFHKYTSELINDFLSFLRIKALGWAISSTLTNFFEGQIANEIAMAMEIYYPSEHWYKATRITRAARIKALSGGYFASDEAKFVSLYMNRYTILQDSRNEFQKAGIKTSFSLTQKLDPMLLNQSVEYLNQSPILVTAMMSEIIEDMNGNKSSLWDAMDKKTGKLKPEFRTDKNILNWEHMQGGEYDAFKIKINKAIVETHGDYDALRGNFAKATVGGKVLLMFKGWWPRAIYNRFGEEQIDLETGRIHKGRYRSHTDATAGMQGALVGLTIGGLTGAGVGFLTGLVLINAYGVRSKKSTSTNASYFKDQAYVLKMLALKTAGIPINRILRRRIIKTDTPAEVFAKFQDPDSFSYQDAQNLVGNVTEMALSILWASFIFATKVIKGAIFDDEDEKEEEKPIENLIVNRAWSLLEQATSYNNPVAMYKNFIGTNPVIKFAEQYYDLIADVNRAIILNDVDASQGSNRGGSKVLGSVRKLLFPNAISPTFGFEKEMEKQRLPESLNQLFWSDYRKAKYNIDKKRLQLRESLREEEKYTEKEINKLVDKKYPTLNSQLKRNKAVYGLDQEDIPKFKEKKRKEKAKLRQKEAEILRNR